MWDPLTVAFEIKSPFRNKPSQLFPEGYRETVITVWHRDPCSDGTDDSCDWFGSKFGWYPVHRDEFERLSEEAKSAVNFTLYLIGDRRHWFNHPRWHLWHWQFQIHPIQTFKRWAFSKCAKCKRRFKWGYCPVSHSWSGPGPRWFRSEINVFHNECIYFDVAKVV
jgi:hypothetical protein